MTSDRIPEHVDASVLELYLNDHLSGAAAGRARAHRMVRAHADLPIREGLQRLAEELDAEFARLTALIEQLGLHRLVHRQLAARLGEELGRLKLNRRLFSRSPMTPVLELELLRGAVNAKAGLWEVLVDLSGELGLDAAEFEALGAQAKDQSARLELLHRQVADGAFRRDRRP